MRNPAHNPLSVFYVDNNGKYQCALEVEVVRSKVFLRQCVRSATSFWRCRRIFKWEMDKNKNIWNSHHHTLIFDLRYTPQIQSFYCQQHHIDSRDTLGYYYCTTAYYNSIQFYRSFLHLIWFWLQSDHFFFDKKSIGCHFSFSINHERKRHHRTHRNFWEQWSRTTLDWPKSISFSCFRNLQGCHPKCQRRNGQEWKGLGILRLLQFLFCFHGSSQ